MSHTLTLSPQQQKLLSSTQDFKEKWPEHHTNHGVLVSGHEYRTALALERKGLGTVQYQGPTMGWFRAS